MEKRNRFIVKVAVAVLILIFVVIFIGISSKDIFNKISNENEMINSYNIKKEKCDLLQSIVNDVIDEDGIHINKIPVDKIKYNIYDEDENIIFYYSLREEQTNTHKYYATITLSNRYQILDKNYSVELETFDEFVESNISANKISSVLLAICRLLFICMIICIIALIVEIIFAIYEKVHKPTVNNNLLGGKKMHDVRKKYCINGWRETKYYLTAKELYERVLEDSKSDYNWIASATELVRICKEPEFPKEYADGIKMAILNCFANLEIRKEFPSRREATASESVSYCYHSLSDDVEGVKKVKEKYLKAIIHAITKYDRTSCRFTIHYGPAYQKVCDDWKKSKLEEYVTKEQIDFEEMRNKLYTDFDETIKKAEDKGVFKADDEKHREEMRKFWQSLDF